MWQINYPWSGWTPGWTLISSVLSCHCHPHLSKRLSDLKQKCTQLLTPFSGMVFHALSHGVIHFARSVSFENQLNRGFWLAVREFPPVRKWFLGLTLRAKQITPCERAWNTVPENSVRNCVHFCLQPLLSLERCDGVINGNFVATFSGHCTIEHQFFQAQNAQISSIWYTYLEFYHWQKETTTTIIL